MSAEILREAAKAARDEWAGEVSGPFKNAARIHLAVAKWLEAIAPRFPSRLHDFEEHLLDREQAAALAVARAYLGESA